MLNYYLVINSYQGKKIINNALEESLKNVILQNFKKNKCELIDIKIEDKSKVIINFCAPPHIKLSALVNSLKTVSSRLIRKEFKSYLDSYDMGSHFWEMKYYIYT